MVLLQPKLNLRVSQKQILTPGLVQMVSVLALNKLELKDMINAEMMENPVLEELDSAVPLLDEVAGREEDRDRAATAPGASHDETPPPGETKSSDPFEEIDFGSFFQEYLDPGYRSPESEYVERPSFENFLSKPTTLTEHLMWQLGSLHVKPEVYAAAELVIGNLNEDGYLTASNEELMAAAAGQRVAEPPEPVADDEEEKEEKPRGETVAESVAAAAEAGEAELGAAGPGLQAAAVATTAETAVAEAPEPVAAAAPVDWPSAGAETDRPAAPQRGVLIEMAPRTPPFTVKHLQEAINLVRQMDPVGVAARDLRECLLAQLQYLKVAHEDGREMGASLNGDTGQVLDDAIAIVGSHLKAVQNKQHKEIAKAIGRPIEAVTRALDFLKTLDPKPGLRYNKVSARLIEPDVAFVKQGEEYIVVMNDEDVPTLRLNPTYRRLLAREAAEKDVRNYVKERYKSAIQLIKNIEQRKQTILKVCYAILGRQRDFLDHGIDHLKPMMIKEVAEEIGVHPSTVSRAVANKYAHTAQGVFELRYFFSESVNGPEGGGTSLLILKRRVKKLIEDEDPSRPLTDEQITRILQSQGIQVTRRTVAKYREDMKIPSTHQRRIRK
ncbi:MAG TPA: RNA polymerase factor sigma-54 [Terriglobales bacterium]|nr:RNA polymerase factor sigma-54 [Terriglobales bacterium]